MRNPISFNGVELEKICPRCNGNPPKTTGWFLGGILWCDMCFANGFLLTEDGKAFCQLVATHLTTSDGDIRFRPSKGFSIEQL